MVIGAGVGVLKKPHRINHRITSAMIPATNATAISQPIVHTSSSVLVLIFSSERSAGKIVANEELSE